MTVNTAPVKISTRGKAIQTEAFRDQEMRRRTLKELEEKTYPFPDSDVVAMLDDLLDKKVIDLPECRRPEEMNRTDSPRYCKFHRFISHPTEKCFVLKDLIMKLAQKGMIELDLDDVVKSNYITVISGSVDSKSSTQPLGACSKSSEVEGWTHVAPKKLDKKNTSPPQVHQSERGKSSSHQPLIRVSVFDRLNRSKPRMSALDRIGGQDRTSVFKRLNTSTPQGSVFKRLSKPKKQSSKASSHPRRSAVERLEETKKPSRKRKTMSKEEKHQATLEVDTEGPLKVKKHTSPPQVHQSEGGQSSFCQPPKQREIVEDDEISTQRSSMRHLFFLEKLFNYSTKVPCRQDCEECPSRIASKKLDKQQPSRPQVHQSERGQNSSCQPPEQCESVGDNEISTQRSSIPITMCNLFPENFFDYSVKAPCYEDCEERLSRIA